MSALLFPQRGESLGQIDWTHLIISIRVSDGKLLLLLISVCLLTSLVKIRDESKHRVVPTPPLPL